MASQLTQNAASRIFSGEQVTDPVLQVFEVKAANGKHKLALSDGVKFFAAVLATQMDPLVSNGEVKATTLLKLKQYVVKTIGTRKAVMLLQVEVFAQPEEMFGTPVNVEGGSAGPSSAPPQTSPQANQSAPSLGRNTAPVVHTDPSVPIMPIESLSPYNNKWTIRARVTSKSDKKSWNNARGSGTLFKVELMDENGGEISGAFFKEACEKFYDQIELNGVYTFSNGRIKVANRQWSSVNNNHEITFGTDAVIHKVADDIGMQEVKYFFRKLDQLESCSPNSTIDVIAVVKSHGDLQELVSKRTGNALVKRDLILVDDTDVEVNLTLWGEKAKEDDAQWTSNPVVAIKKVKVSDYNGCSLSSLQSSLFQFNPTMPEAQELTNWWSERGHASASRNISRQSLGSPGKMRDTSLTSRKNLACIRDEHMGQSEKGDFLTVKASVAYIYRKDGSDPWYVSEPETKYKCVEQPDGTWFCERSNKVVENPQRRYIMSVSLVDHSGTQLVNIFDREAQQLLGMSADEMHEHKCNGEDDVVEKAFFSPIFKDFVCTLKVKQETYNDESRIKTIGVAFGEPDLADESRQLIKAIQAYD